MSDKNTENGTTALATTPRIQIPQRLHEGGALSNLVDSERFGQLQRVATLMGQSALTPQHLKGANQAETTANCFRVVNQALRWEFDPFAVADETYVVRGRLGYQGKLIAGVINARAGLEKRLRAEYSGQGNARTVKVIGKFKGEDDEREVELTLAQAKTDNQMWTKDPDQKLWYSGVIKWARRHCPELILGVLSDDDLEAIAASQAGGEVKTRAEAIGERLTAAPEKPKEEMVKVEEPGQQPQDREQIVDTLKAAIDAAKDLQELADIKAEIAAVEAMIGGGDDGDAAWLMDKADQKAKTLKKGR